MNVTEQAAVSPTDISKADTDPAPAPDPVMKVVEQKVQELGALEFNQRQRTVEYEARKEQLILEIKALMPRGGR